MLLYCDDASLGVSSYIAVHTQINPCSQSIRESGSRYNITDRMLAITLLYELPIASLTYYCARSM